MNDGSLQTRGIEKEVRYKTSRSSGKGGQNVNKVSSKVEIRFNVLKSSLLDDKEKTLIHQKLKNRINDEGDLVLTEEGDRSQLRNKESALLKLLQLLEKALIIPKKRKETKVSKTVKEKRKTEKMHKSLNKQLRRKKPLDN